MLRATLFALPLVLLATLVTARQAVGDDRYGTSSSSSSPISTSSAAAAFDNLDTPPAPQALGAYSRSDSAQSGNNSRYGASTPRTSGANTAATGQRTSQLRDAFSGSLSSSPSSSPSSSSSTTQRSSSLPAKPQVKPLSNASQTGNQYRNDRFDTSQSPSRQSAAPSNYNPLRATSGSNRGSRTNSVSSSPLSNRSSSTTSNTPATSNDKPNRLMRAMMQSPGASQLSGTPYRLNQILSSTNSREEQSSRITVYWDLCSTVADYYLGLREAAELRNLRSRVPKLSDPLRQAESDLSVRLGTSLRAARASQKRLAGVIGGATILPADLPHCGAYETRYAQLFASRGSSEARELHELLPLRHAELQKAADAVLRAEKWVQRIDGRSGPDSDRTAVLRSLELLALNRRAFVQIARDYNRRISRYTELSTPGNIDDGRLVAMLIGRQGGVIATQPSSSSPYRRTR